MKIRPTLAARVVLGFASIGLTSMAVAQVSGCSTGNVEAPTYSSPLGAVTFHKDVEPILQNNCQKCHSAGGIAPFTLTSYDDAKIAASDMVVATTERVMPPWGAYSSSECTPTHGFQDDPRLSQKDIDTLAAWEAAGTPEGNPKDAPPAIVPPALDLPGVQQSLKAAAPYTLTSDSDQFRCFILDPKITQTKYMNGTFVVAGNPEIVHHALIFADAQRESLALAKDGSNQYDCFGGPGTSSPSLIAAWAPGGVPQVFPDNVGMAISPGTLFVMQVHYHPHKTAKSNVDTTTFQIRYLDAPPAYSLITQLVGNFEGAIGTAPGDGLLPGPDDPPSGPQFLIPANAKGHTEEMQLTMPSTIGGAPLPDLYLYSVASHEHYVGTQQMISVTHPPGFLAGAAGTSSSPTDECLLNVPNWNFNWQRFYAYAYDGTIEHLPRIGPGDKLKIKCTYDNTTDNPLLVQSFVDRQMPPVPIDVKLGETTLDEMCLGGFALVYKN